MAYQVLIVDDDEEFRQEMKELLEEYRVLEASNGIDALALIRKPNAIDLIILDVVMPHMSGLDVLREIKTAKPSLAIIILTGKSSKDFAIEALKAHADDYIEKPFDVPKFLLTVKKTIDAKKKLSGVYLNKMQQIKLFIENNVEKKISLQHLSDEVYLSPKYLSRLFKEQTGTGFNEYRLKVKMKQAQRLLQETDKTVEQIALALGYKNAESFIRIFQKMINSTPTEFRQQSVRKKHA